MKHQEKIFGILEKIPKFKTLGLDQKAETFLSIANKINAELLEDPCINVSRRTRELAVEYLSEICM